MTGNSRTATQAKSRHTESERRQRRAAERVFQAWLSLPEGDETTEQGQARAAYRQAVDALVELVLRPGDEARR